MRFRRALDRGNVTEALSSASELEHVGLAKALELCLLIRDKAPERYPRAALRWHGRLCREVDVSLEEAQATLAALALMAGERKGNAAFALADLLSRRGLERPCETLCRVGAQCTRRSSAAHCFQNLAPVTGYALVARIRPDNQLGIGQRVDHEVNVASFDARILIPMPDVNFIRDVCEAKAPRQTDVDLLPCERLRSLTNALPHRFKKGLPSPRILKEPTVSLGNRIAIQDCFRSLPKSRKPLCLRVNNRACRSVRILGR
jgi:hypothetical protein